MKLDLYQLDSFTNKPFAGNPAAVCPLDEWLEDGMLQAIALENNLSETAFLVAGGEGDDFDYHLRWFTPAVEVEFCGHATLAAAKVVLDHLRPELDKVRFTSRVGPLAVSRERSRYLMDFPRQDSLAVDAPAGLAEALGAAPEAVLEGGEGNYLCVYRDAEAVRLLVPDFGALKALGYYGFIATAPGDDGDCDLVSRYFVPAYGIDEDPVTGSIHCMLAPYWATRLGKPDLYARQISARGGELWLLLQEQRVLITGDCVEVMRGNLSF
jgi:PhzF family phenazine biosynthesis protein